MSAERKQITFDTQIKKTVSKNLVSGDKEYESLLRSIDENMYELGKIDPTTTVTVTVEYEVYT